MNRSTVYFSIVLFLSFLFSCSHEVSREELKEANKLMLSYPDSALRILKSIPAPEKMNSANYAAYCLLLTEAQDKTYYTFTSDSVIRVAAEYFLNKDDDHLKARLYYIWGRVHHELLHYIKAQECYLQAISFAQKENDYPLLLRIHNQCGNLYRNRKLYDKALSSLHEALKYCKLADDQNNLPYCLRDIGRVHLLTGKTDSTLYYFHQAINSAIKAENKFTESVIYQELGIVYKRVGKYRKAIEAIKYSVDMNTIIEDPSSCLTLGSLYLHLNNTDSAAYFLTYAQKSRNPYTTAGANYYKYKLAVQTEDYKQAIYYNELYKAQKDSLDALADKDDLSDVIHRFEQEELKNRLELSYVQSQRSYLIILLIVITALGTVVIIYYRYRFRKEKEFTEQQQKLQIEKNKFAIMQKQFREQEAILLGKENQLLQLREERKILGDHFLTQTQYKERIYLTDPTYESEESQNLETFSVKEINELKEVLNLLYNNFTNRLQHKYSLLSKQDIDICCLVKVGAKTRHLAKLLCMNSDSITKKKRLILKKIDSSTNQMNLSDFLDHF